MCKRYINQLPLTCPHLGTWATTQACALTGNRTSDPSVCRPALNPLSYTRQGYLFIFREEKGGRKRGRETLMCERYIYRLPLTHPQPQTWPTTQACALAGIELVTFHSAGRCPTH